MVVIYKITINGEDYDIKSSLELAKNCVYNSIQYKLVLKDSISTRIINTIKTPTGLIINITNRYRKYKFEIKEFWIQ